MSKKTKAQLETELQEAQFQIARLQRERQEETFARAFRQSPAAMSITRVADGKFIEVNEAFLRTFEFSREEVIGRISTELNMLTPEARRLLSERQPALGGLQNIKAEALSKSGRIIPLLVSFNPIDLSGEPHYVTTLIDITERTLVEEALRESEARFSTAFFTSPVSQSIITQGSNQIIEVNEACCQLFGYNREELIGFPTSKLNLWHNAEDRLAALEELRRSGHLRRKEVTILGKSGQARTGIGAIEPIMWKGTPCLISFVFDITDGKNTEAALHESNERFRQIAETIQDVFWIFDNEQKRLIYISPALETVWGLSSDPDLEKVSRSVVAAVLPEDRPLLAEILERQSGNELTESEFRIVHTDGELRWIHLRSFPVLDPNGRVTRTIGLAADITNRKKAEQDVSYRQELLEKVIRLGKDIASLTDLDSCLLEIYRSVRFELGFDRVGLFLYDATLEHLLGVFGTSRTGEIVSPGFFDGPIQQFNGWEKALQSPSGVSWIGDYQHLFNVPEGDEMYGVGEHIVVAAWAGEKPVGLITTDNLLSGRKIKPAEVEALHLFAGYAGLAIENASLHAELELKVEERTAEVKDLYDNAPTGYHSLDRSGCFIEINKTELQWLGYTREEVLGHSLTEFLTQKSLPVFRQNFPGFQQRGWIRSLELELIRKDGSTFPVLVSATAIYDRHGNYLMSRSTMFDNTEHKRANDALRQSEETYRALFQHANDGIFIFGLDRSIQSVNPSGAKMLGVPAEELIGLFDKDFLEPEHTADSERRGQEVIDGKHIPVYERRLRKKDGTWLETEINLSLIRDALGNPRFIQSVVRDVSTRKRAEETLRLANIELERALRLKDEFLASMSHELRTPLTGILGLSESLQYDTYGELTARQKSVLASIESNGHHLLDLINDILDISKMEAGKLELEMVSCSLDEICQSSLELVKGMAQRKGQRLTFSMDPTGIFVRGDARRIKQILVNLMSNAIKYSPEKSPIGLDVKADPSTQSVQIKVWDQGIGIAPQDLKKLFQPFVQLDSSLSRQQSGTGLGLALAQRLVELHGGGIQVESKPGHGSCFTVRLPYLPGVPTPKQEEPSDLLPIQHSLIVEDNAIDANRLTRFLRLLGIQTMVEPSGKDVVERATTTQPAVIFLDINLPDMTGWDVLAKLKGNEATRNIPVVITSVAEDCKQASRLGAAGYLLKLFTLEELSLILSRLPKPVGAHRNQALVISPNAHAGVIMIVDDNETNILMIEDFLRSRHYKVFTCKSGVDFLARVSGIRPDVVLMDIQMPELDGLQTMRRLRSHSDAELASTPLIAITALAMPGDRERCLEAGANEYVSKPVRLKDLVMLIERLLMDKQAGEESPSLHPDR